MTDSERRRLYFWIAVFGVMAFLIGVTLTLAIITSINEPGGICI